MKRLLLTGLLCAAFAGLGSAQSFRFVPYDSIPVTNNGSVQRLAWAGGLQAPQFSRIDLNGDGIKDLVVFDRADNAVLTFLNSGSPAEQAYTYRPEYALAFPAGLDEWLLLADYNCDGKEDLFTAVPDMGGIAVYTNTSSGSTLSFQLATSLLTSSNGQVQVPSTDLPALADADNDGDLDILAFGFAGDFVTWYQNRRVEDNLPCSALSFGLGSLCWGQFQENAFNSSITLGVSCRYGQGAGSGPADEKAHLHAGSTLLVYDADGDNDKDALIGDISSALMTYLENGGSNRMTSQTTSYPASQPVNLNLFPAAFHLDMDNDQLPDLVMAPNIGQDGVIRNTDQVLFYPNTGTASAPSYTFRKSGLLVDQMIDAGGGAAPAFADLTGDGTLDLLLGNSALHLSSTNSFSQLTLLRNTGTNAAPAYELAASDYLGLRALGLNNLCPAFGDLDGDGDADLLLGEQQGRLLHLVNTAAAGQPASFSLQPGFYAGITVSNSSTPHLADLDRDGDLDLLVGARNGKIAFYRNTGIATSASFSLENPQLGGILITSAITAGYTAPFVTDLDQDGQYDLLVGDYDGRLHVYLSIEQDLAGTFTEFASELYFPAVAQARPLRLSGRLIPAALDLSGDGRPDIAAGITRGGLHLLRNSGITIGRPELAGPELALVYPTVAGSQVHFVLPGPQQQTVQVQAFTVQGQEVALPASAFTRSSGTLQVGHLPAGLYLLRFRTPDGAFFNQKIMRQ